jgi:hypothetical protein
VAGFQKKFRGEYWTIILFFFSNLLISFDPCRLAQAVSGATAPMRY